MSDWRPRAVLIGAMLLLGVALSIGYNTYAQAGEVQPERAEGLADLVAEMESERLALEDGLAELRGQIDELESRAAEEAGMAESFSRDLEEVRASVGLSGVRGPGVVVMLSDAESVPPGQDPSACIVHDFDVASIVNVLFSSGAEAVSVNDERVVVTTAVRCAGNTILVNSRRLGNPYIIRAVGDSDELEGALRTRGSVSPLFDTYPTVYGLGTSIERESELEIPAYRGSLRTEFAAPQAGGE